MAALLIILINIILTVMPLVPRPVSLAFDGTYAFTYLDPATGVLVGSANQTRFTSTVESMVKPWIAADYLRRATQVTAARLRQITTMLREGSDPAAEALYRADGTDAIAHRMISICRLRHTRVRAYWWSYTTMPTVDAAALGLCLADGRAAGPRWTPWLLRQMRATDRAGHWGVVDGLPRVVAARTAIKNGWTVHPDGWHVNCLAIHPRFVLAVMTVYPARHGLAYGARACAQVARKLSLLPGWDTPP